MKKYFFWGLCLLFYNASHTQPLYFPPLSNAANWDTISMTSLGWCSDKTDSLYNFLQQENTKAFIVLKNGKIVLEKYFDGFGKDSTWYWASAGKTLTAFLIGKAQEDGRLSLADTSSKYLGSGWTVCSPTQENNIKIRNQLTMTSGLDDGVPDNHCTIDTCLQYLAPPGNRWAYHNAPYTLLEKVIVNATGQSINAYTNAALKLKTGMTGQWFMSDYDNVFFSKPRSMARFGLLMQNKCIWNTDTLLRDTSYYHQCINSSQSLNLSYGYLWWLNGKSSFMLPTSQFVFNGYLASDAPPDMYAGIGKNGQLLSISPSKGLVIVRMGNAPSSSNSEVPAVFLNQIWQKLNTVMCESNTVNTYTFIGSGNWSDASNWLNGLLPPALADQRVEILINPIVGGECILNIPQTINNGGKLKIMAGKKFRVIGNMLTQ